MKLNNYKLSLLSWGILIFLGYILQLVIRTPETVILTWTAVTALALFIQIFLTWSSDRKTMLLQIIWIFICVLGGILTYFLWFNIFSVSIHINAFWMILLASGMCVTAFTTRVKKYFFFTVIYAIAAIIFQFTDISDSLILAGGLIGALCVVDAFIE